MKTPVNKGELYVANGDLQMNLSQMRDNPFSLSFALSMGELGATLMIYPPGWVTLPVGIFALSDRGAIFDASTLTMVLGACTLLVLLGLSRISTKAAVR